MTAGPDCPAAPPPSLDPPGWGLQRVGIAQLCAWLAGWAVVIPLERYRFRELPPQFQNWAGWFTNLNRDSTLYCLLLAIAPLVWRYGRAAGMSANSSCVRETQGSSRRALCLALVVGLVAFSVSAAIGSRFGDWPPAYHDEFSYLFQAESFLAGRAAYPSHALAPLFDQMHVLNEGRFASRYFPGTGAWLAPWLALGHPYWGQWFAEALCAVLIFYSGRELGGDWAGLLAGLLTGLSPGMVLFSNLLLSHHATLLGLSLFLLGYLRMRRQGSAAWAVVSGIGLAFAMLCRPLTAAGVAFPFGVDLLVLVFRRTSSNDGDACDGRSRLALLLGMGIPLLVGFALLFLHNRAVTGSGWVTPYQQYTDVYTPSHVYGFDNVVRGRSLAGPKVLANYDQWAENLTPRLAAENFGRRIVASGHWTLGLVPLALALVAGLVLWPALPYGLKLVFAGIVSLHAVYLPYWYDGIMHWHYVFETAPLWVLWFAVVSVKLLAWWRHSGRPGMIVWWSCLLLTAELGSYVTSESLWLSRMDQGVGELAFARKIYSQFRDGLAAKIQQPALVLIESDPADRHIDFVVNSPDLQASILRGRFRPAEVPLEEIRKHFPNRSIYLYRARERDLALISPPSR